MTQLPPEIARVIATLGDSGLPGDSLSSANRLAEKPHPLRAHALLALARAGQQLPPVADLKPGTVAALALAMDRRQDHAEQLEAWARNLQLAPGARGAAAFALALRKPSNWPEVSSRLRNASKPGDRFSAALDQVDAWVRSGHVPPAVDWAPATAGQNSGKASRALMVVPATPGWGTAVGGLWLDLKPVLVRVGRWGWWKDGPAQLECFSNVDALTWCRVEDRFTPIYLGGYAGEIAVSPEPGTPLPPEDEGLEWMVLEKTLDRDDGI